MSQFSRPHPTDYANDRPRSSPADNAPIVSRTLSESSVAAYSDEAAPAYSLVYIPESERGLQAVPRSLLSLRITSEEAYQDTSRTATAYHHPSISFSNSAAFSTDDNDAGGYVHDSDPSDEGHALSGGSEQPAATLRDSEPATEARPSTATRGGSRNAGSERSREGTDNSASSATNAERDGQEGQGGDDGETL
ncbi:uncharacterized protein TRAVEDRAFT_20826 [Trametes versicolor FP-101664 SS1]|uniref:uncharacterized protein n=1 Tax=Trametes versicolor (strain FP-101664) TaxID=717944 RepID=UPI0004621525|nr:uncharacterized protein TRAVEDRAFT_20826 [Trametes versicolor FP-101664 SS1]EIW59033.1 hypothetical protein TRAVEDRAFT_20826 [Trametes versicolor FP-101664 SS1]